MDRVGADFHKSIDDIRVKLRTDSGGASRFFYTAKASGEDRGRDNTHPTVKPVESTTYLAKLILPLKTRSPTANARLLKWFWQ